MAKKKEAAALPEGLRLERLELSGIRSAAKNPKGHAERELRESLGRFGYIEPVVLDERTGRLVAGHGRVQALRVARKAGEPPPKGVEVQGEEWLVPVLRGWASRSDAEAEAYLLASNNLTMRGGWEAEGLAELLQGLAAQDALAGTGFGAEDIAGLLEQAALEKGEGGEGGGGSEEAKAEAREKLSERFGAPPFSVFNAREGWWQQRKQAWRALGIRSELGRDAAPSGSPMVSGYSADGKRQTGMVSESGTSIFDPVLCELLYRWFCPPGGRVLDPFAGGSVRGIVAAQLGRRYTGVELRAEQVDANRSQAQAICAKGSAPEWVCGDSRQEVPALPMGYDFVFSCPPYADLERYSDDPRDLSTMGWEEFRSAYFDIIREACAKLKPDRFAAFVVGEVRAGDGYLGFVPATIAAFEDAGLSFYNEAILVTAVGSLPLRAGRAFSASRKLGKTHQNVLVFVKGSGKAAAKACGDVEVELPLEEGAEE